MRLRDLTPGQVRQFLVTAGKFRGKKFESLYEDKDYVKWILEHLNGKSKVMAFGMKQVLVLLELRMREDYKPTTKTVVKKGEPTSAGSARGGSPSEANKPEKGYEKNIVPTCQDTEMTEEEMSQWAHIGRMEAMEIGQTELQGEVQNVSKRLDMIEAALGTIIQQLQKPKEV